MRVPENYSGNTFREPTEAKQEDPSDAVDLPTSEEKSDDKAEQNDSCAALIEPRLPRFRIGSLFGKDRGIGTEELLILALILLLSDTDDSDGFDDLILFLVLLFFIK
jgi:hypothetical protein